MLEPCCTPSRPTRWGHHVNSSRPARHATTVFTALGALGIRLFDESATVWDYYRGRELPDANTVSAKDILELGKLSTALRQSKWRESTRALYTADFMSWVSFGLVNGCSIMPAEPRWIELWLTFMTLNYAASTVATAAAGLVAMHLWNDHPHPFCNEVGLKQMLEGVEKCGICRQSAPKFIVDSNFIVSMCTMFLEKYPFFRKEWFDPTVKGGKSILWLRQVGLVLLGVAVGVRPSSLVALTAY